MKFLVLGLLTLLSVLPKEQLLGSAIGCSKRYLRRINGKCYYFSVQKLNWYGALNNCLRKGLTLADLSNPGDFYGAINFLSSKGNTEDFWFGGNDLDHEGRFQYISNGRLVKFFSNYSLVEPSEHSECDDCLEARIRSNLTVVADDNCLERQYFICTERYCTDEAASGKPRHHSHEHLHHFHHDIGDEDEGSFLNDPSLPSATSSEESAASSSEGDVDKEDIPDVSSEIFPDTENPEIWVEELSSTGSSNNTTTASSTKEGGEASPTGEDEGASTTGQAEGTSPTREGEGTEETSPIREGEGTEETSPIREGEGTEETSPIREGEGTTSTTSGDGASTISPPEVVALDGPKQSGPDGGSESDSPSEDGETAAIPENVTSPPTPPE